MNFMNENATIIYNDMQRLSVRALMLSNEDIEQMRSRITFIQDEDDQKLMTIMLDALINYHNLTKEEWDEQTSSAKTT